jgi:hypothetical protein
VNSSKKEIEEEWRAVVADVVETARTTKMIETLEPHLESITSRSFSLDMLHTLDSPAPLSYLASKTHIQPTLGSKGYPFRSPIPLVNRWFSGNISLMADFQLLGSAVITLCISAI